MGWFASLCFSEDRNEELEQDLAKAREVRAEFGFSFLLECSKSHARVLLSIRCNVFNHQLFCCFAEELQRAPKPTPSGGRASNPSDQRLLIALDAMCRALLVRLARQGET